MDAIQKIEPVAWRRKEAGGWWVYYETKAHDDLEPLYADQTLASKEAELTAREAEIANQALNYVSLFGELQNAMAEIARLLELLAGCRTVFALALDNGKGEQYASLETRRGSFIHCVELMQDLDAALTKQPPKD